MSVFRIYVPGTGGREVLIARVGAGLRGKRVVRPGTGSRSFLKIRARAKGYANYLVHLEGHEWARVEEFKPRRVVYEARKASR